MIHLKDRRPRSISIVSVLAALVLAATTVSTGRSPTVEDLGFLVGEWRLETWSLNPNGETQKGSANLSVTTSMGGMALLVQSYFPGESDFAGFHSTTTYVFNKRLGSLVGAGINSLGNAKQYTATWEDDRLVVIQSGMLFGGRPGINRLTYFDMEPNKFSLIHEHSPDDGVTWEEPRFGYAAFRTEQPRPQSSN